ncbi:hypothetical protein LA303_06385 [Candidatus Sulfidibacterium hydrothermale]|uniref:hypothetical protein n=1 Tax=Candidatus Sulfidibacterium hydrothermale TaxID=2875962 RepID=UPI001F0A9D4E|nr:hypothetical protein [Candidatus Sulfidibacterium hydrothermale]UBM61053.1 hypothetical protein LA303_06385 [Candidatus Sulfidibacterium hydrothermale]
MTETTIGYFVIFGLVLAFALFSIPKRGKQRYLPLDRQSYPDFRIAVYIQKEKRKITTLIIELLPTKAIQLETIQLELSDALHNKKSINLKTVLSLPENQPVKTGEKTEFSLPFSIFIDLLEHANFTFENFRLVAVTSEGKKYKTRLLAYHPRWGIFKADSGKYN